MQNRCRWIDVTPSLQFQLLCGADPVRSLVFIPGVTEWVLQCVQLQWPSIIHSIATRDKLQTWLAQSNWTMANSRLHCTTSWSYEMEMLSALLALCEGNLLVTGGVTSQRTRNTDLWCFLEVSRNELLNKHSSGQWWCSCDIIVMNT